MECLRCKSNMKKGFPNFNCEILKGPVDTNLVIGNKPVGVNSVYVCPSCGYIEFSNKTFTKEHGYNIDLK